MESTDLSVGHALRNKHNADGQSRDDVAAEPSEVYQTRGSMEGEQTFSGVPRTIAGDPTEEWEETGHVCDRLR